MSSADRFLAVLAAVALLLSCGACSQRWKFARAEYPMHGTGALPPPQTQPGVLGAPGIRQAAYAPPHSTPYTPPPPQRSRVVEPAFASAPVAPAVVAPGVGTRLRSMWQETKHNVRSDYRNYYSFPGMRDLWVGVALAAPFANTSLDSDFQHWYQDDVRSSGCDDFAAFWKTFGEGKIFIPVFAGLGLAGGLLEDRPLIGIAGDFGDRVTRSYLVGAPPMLFMQFLLGGSRPGETSVGSQWKPFDDINGVSGHAFIGAVPFITAAKMAENPWAKSTLYICSTFTAWSRINDNQHYASQAVLGWWMAYLACRAVDDTERRHRCVTLAPLVTPEMVGVGVVARR